MNIAELYEDERFTDNLVYLAEKKGIKDFDDYRQSVFLEIIDSQCDTYKQCQKAANRVAFLYAQQRYSEDIMQYAFTNDSGEPESDDEVMSRMIHDGMAVQLG